ncbi:MAG TPA: hypothetical protein VL025_19645, partial [Thermoanaerobaculia bacterium]|nr:hypothetical protein [Thermoanaerobaculia bacterium]
MPLLQKELVETAAPAFEQLVRALLRLALAPPDRLLRRTGLEPRKGGLLVRAGETGLPVFVQPLALEGLSEDLGPPDILRCREALERFADSPLSAEVYLLVHNRDPRSPAFRNALDREIAAFRETG